MSGAARADAGTLRFSEKHGGYEVSVFTSPAPLRAGPVDVSVLVQATATGQPVADGHVAVRAWLRERPAEVFSCPATAEAATNKLFRAAVFEVPEPGLWDVEVRIDGLGEPFQVQFSMEAAVALPRWMELWPWVIWPLAATALFAVHQTLVRRTTRKLIHIRGF